MNKHVFEVLIDNSLSNISSSDELVRFVNKSVLSLVNDFEDTQWRYPKFQSYLWDNIAQTALSEKERSALVDQNHSSLIAAAQNLRLTDKDKIGSGSEIAEIFLYGIMRNYFGALPVVPKIFYKQNVQDNAKGADSVHIVLDENDFTLWFGEAKFYSSIADARLDSIVTSVFNSLSTNKLRKENAIITNVSDIDSLEIPTELRDKIKQALCPKESIDHLKPKICVPILLLHECAITGATTEFSNAYIDEITKFHIDRAEAYFLKQIANSNTTHLYDQIRFCIILFPVPDKKKIVEAFTQAVTFYKGQK